MRVSVTISDEGRPCSLPECGKWIDVHGRCPACNHGELRVIGDERNQDIGSHTIKAPALALCCGQEIGVVLVELSTIFGIEEDRAVLVHGRARVY